MIAVAVLAVKVSLLLCAIWTAAQYLERRGASASSLHAIWLCGFGALALLPLCMLLLPSLPLRLLPYDPSSLATQPVTAIDPDVDATSASRTPTAPFIAYLIGVVVLLLRLVGGQLILERLWRRSRPLNDTRALATARDVCSLLGVRRKVEIRLLEDVIPMTWGSARPRLLLPADVIGWDQDRLRSVLLHETGHIVRHDSLARIIVETISAFYWLHPGVWLAGRRMRLAQEQASDDLALSHAPSAVDYARHLLASASSAGTLHVAPAMANSTDLGCRVQAILEDVQRNTPSIRFLTLTSALTLVLATSISAIVLAPVVPAAAPMLIPTTASIEEPARAQRTASSRTKTEHESVIDPSPRRHLVQVASPMTSHDPRSQHAPSADEYYRAQLAQYGEEVQSYNSQLKRYSAELAEYGRANAEFVRKARAYQDRMAELGPDPPPGTVLPTYPVAPTEPVYPTAPTVPVEPPRPPTAQNSVI